MPDIAGQESSAGAVDSGDFVSDFTSRMPKHVLLKISTASKPLATHVASVRLFATVNKQVSLETERLRERLLTDVTYNAWPLTRV